MSWDRAVKLDLAACRGLRFDFYCADVTPVSQFSFYLHSRDGWYATTFGQTDRQGWSTVVIDKTDTRIEDRPAGWGTIDNLRISAWRGKDVDTEFYIANLAVEGADAPIAIVRGESLRTSSPDEADSVTTFSRNVAEMLDSLGLPYVVMSDLDVTAERLQGKTIVILPHNPRMPAQVTEELVRFVGRGGKLLAFYSRAGETGGGGWHSRRCACSRACPGTFCHYPGHGWWFARPARDRRPILLEHPTHGTCGGTQSRGRDLVQRQGSIDGRAGDRGFGQLSVHDPRTPHR